MTCTRNWKKALSFGLIGVLALLTMPLLNESANTSANALMAPDIKITVVPPRGPGGADSPMVTIGGTTNGVDFSKHKVVIYVRTDKWYVQPFANNPYTNIAQDGKWENDTRLGHEYAALLVKSSYPPPPQPRVLPQVGGDVLATFRVEGK
jgi:hypothetical protein